MLVLTWHAIDERSAVISMAPGLFRQQVETLAGLGFRGISLAQACEHLEQTGAFPDRSVVLTFDDGFRSVYGEALPLLAAHGFSATVFLGGVWRLRPVVHRDSHRLRARRLRNQSGRIQRGARSRGRAHGGHQEVVGQTMKNFTARFITVLMAGHVSAGIAAETEEGFRSIFDGQSLAGWETPDLSYWTVEDGAITGRITKEHPCTVNQYLVWQGGELADFELKLKSRLNGEGGINNGFQFRSRLLPDHDVCGYQMDNNLQTPWLARLYDEYGRHTLAWRGERAVFDADGNRAVTKITEAEGAAWFRLEDWHEYHLICVGPRITLRVNDQLVAVVEDNDPRRRELQGILALQLHSGPPTVVQFKDIRLKELKAAAPPGKSSGSVPKIPLTRPSETLSPLS